MLRWVLPLIIEFGVAFAVFGQQKQPPFHIITTDQGLSESSNSYIYRDHLGFMWISSVNGLNRFDGQRTVVFLPDSNNIHSIFGSNIQSYFFEDARNDIWFATDKGLNCFRRDKGYFDRYSVRKKDGKTVEESHYVFHLDQNGGLWVVASDSLFVFDTRNANDQKAFRYICPLPLAPRCAMYTYPDGRKQIYISYWAYGPGCSVVALDAENNLVGQVRLLENSDIICFKVLCDRDGHAWFATTEGLLHVAPQPSGDNYHLIRPPDNGGVRSIDWMADKQLLLNSSSGKVWVFNTQTKDFKLFKSIFAEIDGLQTTIEVKTLNVIDEFLWCSTPGLGVTYAPINERKSSVINLYDAKQTGTYDFEQIYEDDMGNIALTTRKNLCYQVLSSRPDALKINALPEGAFLFRDRDKKTCIYAQKALYEFPEDFQKLKIKKTLSQGLSQVEQLLPATDNSMLATTFEGVFQISLLDGTVTKLPFFNQHIINAYADKHGLLWLCGPDKIEVYNLTHGLPSQFVVGFDFKGIINQFAEDQNNRYCIWIATSAGLLCCNTQTWKLEHITQKDGLPDEYIQSVVSDHKGRLWLGTNKGIVRFMPDAPAGERFLLLDKRNGFSSKEYCRGIALRTQSGLLCFGGKQGIDLFHPDSIGNFGPPPQLAIVGLKIHDHEWRDSTTCIEMAERIELEYNQNTLRLELAAMEYTDPEMNKFRVRLLFNGNDTSWVELGTQNFITYANLRPGQYRFEFTGSNSEGVWQPVPRRLDIIIHPHFSDTLWFKILISVAVLAVLGFSTAFYYRYRLRLQQLALEKQQREAERKQLLLEKELSLQEERNRIADEMHDELGGGLSTIRLASQRAKRLQSPEELQQILNRVSQISIGLVNNMRGIIWAMDSQNDSLRSLLAYIRQYAVTFLDDNAIGARLDFPAEFEDRALSSQYRHNVMLTVKECLNNILKHAEAKTVQIKVLIDNDLHIAIVDDGKGFDPVEHLGRGKGLRTTVKRMESVGGSIDWIRNTDAGMTIQLRAPLREMRDER